MEECVVQQKSVITHAVGAKGVQAALQLGKTDSRVVMFIQCLQQSWISVIYNSDMAIRPYIYSLFYKLDKCIHSIQYIGRKKKMPTVQNMEENKTLHITIFQMLSLVFNKNNNNKEGEISLLVSDCFELTSIAPPPIQVL